MTVISVVIGTRNQRAVLAATLDAFGRQTLGAGAFEVVVVDSASDDGTAGLCQGQSWPMPLRYARRENTGKCAARNDAIRQAQGRLVLLTDADVIPDPELLARHVAAHEQGDARVIVGRQFLIDRIEEIGDTRREALRPTPHVGAQLTWRQFVTGNASLPRTHLVDAGLFDEDFGGYGYEDYELGYRLAARGLTFVFEPSAVNWHCHRVTFEDDLPRKRDAGRAAVLFARKHPSRALRTELGLHAANRLLWRLAADEGWLVRLGRSHAGASGTRGRLARGFLLEQAFQAGVREAESP